MLLKTERQGHEHIRNADTTELICVYRWCVYNTKQNDGSLHDILLYTIHFSLAFLLVAT
jgi:hypothetical protein